MNQIKFLAVHHTAALNTGKPQLYAVDRFHQQKWGMLSKKGWWVGYNYFCDVDGKRTNTREIGEETIAQIGHNCNVAERCDTISYCMAGDFRSQKHTEAQERDFREFVDEMRSQYPSITVVGHRDLQAGRSCPELPQEYIDSFNKILDSEDTLKKEKIRELQQVLDVIRSLVVKLLSLFNKKT